VGRVVYDGEVITMQVDPINWQIRWTVGNLQLAATTIPYPMRVKTLYVVIIMVNQNDVVELQLEADTFDKSFKIEVF